MEMNAIPPRECHKEMVEAIIPIKFFHDEEIKELYEKY
jgi:hypothetical protein